MADDVAELDDLALIRMYRDGDAGAFDRIFTRYNQRIRALCARYVGDGQLAEDLVQETFYNVLKTLNRVDDTFHFSAWIYRIAVNLCHDELRRRDKVQHHIEPGGDDVEEAVMRLVDHDRERSPESALEITSMRRVVWEVAKQLPERQRMVLTLRELQGLSYASIAHVMGISQSAVETLLHRARRRFKELYLKQEGSVDSSGDCATVTHILEHIGRRNLRQDQKRMLVNHLEACKDCRARFPARSTTTTASSDATSTSASAAAGAAG